VSDEGFKWVPLAGGMLDQIECDCGWQSATFFDGDVYAYAQWKRHVKAGHAADTRLTASHLSRMREPMAKSPKITLRCPECKRTMRAVKDDSDPLGTAIVEVLCDKCDDGGGFPETHYYDANGRWFNGEQFVAPK